MSKQNNDIPVLLSEILSEAFEPEQVLGYRYAAGYLENDEISWDLPIQSFIKDPYLQIFFANDEKDKSIVIREIESLSRAGNLFEDLCCWLSQKFQSGNSRKQGVFGVVKEEDTDIKEKYMVEFEWSNEFIPDYDALSLIEDIGKMMPPGFTFQKYDGWGDFLQGCYCWHWAQEEHLSPAIIKDRTCWVYGEHHYHTNRVYIWYQSNDSSAISPIVAKRVEHHLQEYSYDDCQQIQILRNNCIFDNVI